MNFDDLFKNSNKSQNITNNVPNMQNGHQQFQQYNHHYGFPQQTNKWAHNPYVGNMPYHSHSQRPMTMFSQPQDQYKNFTLN